MHTLSASIDSLHPPWHWGGQLVKIRGRTGDGWHTCAGKSDSGTVLFVVLVVWRLTGVWNPDNRSRRTIDTVEDDVKLNENLGAQKSHNLLPGLPLPVPARGP
jgi:hypothetical protein